LTLAGRDRGAGGLQAASGEAGRAMGSAGDLAGCCGLRRGGEIWPESWGSKRRRQPRRRYRGRRSAGDLAA